MYGTFFKIVPKIGKKNELVEFFRWDAAIARATEPGTMRFDVWEHPRQSGALYVYEAYANPSAFAKHQANEPYQRYVSYVERELLEPAARDDVFGFTDSLISNEYPVWRSNSQRVVTPQTNPSLSKLSFTSFPLDSGALSNFDDYAELRHLAEGKDASVAHVHFPPGVRTYWHRHEGEQLLWFIEGEGKVVLRDDTVMFCRAGDIVRVGAGSSHWHGASTDRRAVHIAITTGDTVWEERVAESQ